MTQARRPSTRPPSEGRFPGAGFPAADACGHFGLRIGRDGTWYYHGSPIGRKAITKLFATVLRRENDGSYWLVTPAERGRIDVDDVPFVAVDMDLVTAGGKRRLVFTTNLDEIVAAGPANPIWLAECKAGSKAESRDRAATDGPVPYLHVRDGLNARLSRPVYYRLAELAVARDGDGGACFGVWSDGAFFSLEPTDAGSRRAART